MKISYKITTFIILYTAIFYFFRNSDYYNDRLLFADMGGIPWLYATIGSIFGIISAFIIQKEWSQWNNLQDASRSEIQALRELWLWTENLSDNNKNSIRRAIIEYLEAIINEGWKKMEKGERSLALEKALVDINSAISQIAKSSSDQHLVSTTFKLFSNITRYRIKRTRYSTIHMPTILNYAFRYATSLIIFLSMFITIKNIEIHFLFTISIGLLVYTIYIVAEDLDHPLRPGGWHFSTKNYQSLLKILQLPIE
jgi:hypothetical protein